VNAPRKEFGPFTALRDLWTTNMALLAARSSVVGASYAHQVPQMDEFEHIASYDWGSLIIAEHEVYF
jgi:hypothetical protein